MGHYLRLAGFFAVSLALHLLLVFGGLASCGGGAAPGGAPPAAEGPPVREDEAVRIELYVPPQPEAPDGEEEPLRLSSNREDPAEGAAPAPAEQADEPLPAPAEEAAAPVPEPAERAEERVPEPAEEAAERPPPAAEVRRIESPQELKQEVERLSVADKAEIRTRMGAADYRRHLQRMDLGKVKGAPTPELLLAYRDVQEIFDVHRYYGMKVVALDPASPGMVVEVAGLGTPDVAWQRIEGFNWKSYSNRIFERTAPYFANLRRRMEAEGAAGPGYMLCSVSPSGVDAYLRHKQLENIRRAGFGQEEVGSVLARFRSTSFGGWVLEVTQLHLKDGRVVPVRDFELEALR